MKKILLPILMLFSITLGSAPSTVYADSSVDTTADTELNQNINYMLNKKGYSGTLLVVKDGKMVYQTSRGFADFANGVSNDADTTYEIDSVQKSMTAAMIMKQVQKKKLRLTDKLHEFYPEIPGSKKITIRQMLDMTSGLSLKGNIGPDRVMSDADIIDTDIGNIKFSNLMYNKWNYSAINFNLLSGILEQITGKSYRKLFTETYIKKLKLKNTIFAYDDKPSIQKAVGYSNIDPISANLDYRNALYTKKSFEFDELGTGQVYMSAYDLYKVEKYIMTGSMLTKKSRAKLFTPGSISTYGGGLYHGNNDNFANGWGYGFQTVVHMSDDGQNAVIVLQNYERLAADIKPTAKQIYQMITN
ncbi:Beta-lactamase class C related penicillin binding protein [Companilactobacillus mindensis DSM 14500]|uniref:Beta-lactamase class C related penicillin binding protein n=1 Tax=Companilactobacillus mindensis DSM 14500 TaxID=1423770 RepID=A0A0R1QTM9_9LACO|nr:serine hydrolase domain-containing protein [Companilactobacillus mindensis]KRL44579.1 Beta-lactamase class C related penicillin binding protein [Companilactobacillus mindensis DSM 14500]GEO78223.1 peptidase S12 [Companilactobacillus mindensis]